MPQTITITNFGGRLTRILNGDLNSGFAKYSTSWGYDPFSKPGNLTWLESSTEITGPIKGLPLDAKTTSKPGVSYSGITPDTFVLDSVGSIYAMTSLSSVLGNVDSVLQISSVKSGSATFTYGGSMEFFGTASSVAGIYVGHDKGVSAIGFDGNADRFIGNSGNYKTQIFRPVKQWLGKLYFSNGNTVASIDSTGTITSSIIGYGGNNLYSDLLPFLPAETEIQDIDVTPDGNYLEITGANFRQQIITQLENSFLANAVNSALFSWNGTDAGITSLTNLPGYFATALETYFGSKIFFGNDAIGMSVSDGNQKILTMPNNLPPSSNATSVNGNFLTFLCVETDSASNRSYATLYYYGSLDQENPPGLWRMVRIRGGSLTGYVYQAPLNRLVTNTTQYINNTYSSIVTAYGKHYLGVGAITTSGATSNVLLRFNVTPTGTGTPVAGVYETQTQLFSKKQKIKQIRVYTEPTASGNAFNLDCINVDGTIISGGSLSYTFAAGSDITQLQGALTRINFNPVTDAFFGIGLRFTNNGTTAMTIKKVEVDLEESGK